MIQSVTILHPGQPHGFTSLIWNHCHISAVDLWLILTIGLAPGLFWLWYFYSRDKYEPEPLSLIAKMFFLGMVAAVIAFFLENMLISFVTGILFVALVVPVVEEVLKFSMVALFMYRDQEFDEPMDGIVYATATALGFATLENIVYVLDIQTLSSLFVTGSLRAILSVPAHALFAVFWGYSLGIAKFMPAGGRRTTVIFGGLVLAIVTHGIFNLLLEQSYTGLAVLLLLLLPIVWWVAEKRIRAALLGAGPRGKEESI
jgi:RsiW-degrading membrane proteinase PrsW (M82 family)